MKLFNAQADRCPICQYDFRSESCQHTIVEAEAELLLCEIATRMIALQKKIELRHG